MHDSLWDTVPRPQSTGGGQRGQFKFLPLSCGFQESNSAIAFYQQGHLAMVPFLFEECVGCVKKADVAQNDFGLLDPSASISRAEIDYKLVFSPASLLLFLISSFLVPHQTTLRTYI